MRCWLGLVMDRRSERKRTVGRVLKGRVGEDWAGRHNDGYGGICQFWRGVI